MGFIAFQAFRPFAFRYAGSAPASASSSPRLQFNKTLVSFLCLFVFLSFLLLLIDIAGLINNEPDFIHSLPAGPAIYIIFNSQLQRLHQFHHIHQFHRLLGTVQTVAARPNLESRKVLFGFEAESLDIPFLAGVN